MIAPIKFVKTLPHLNNFFIDKKYLTIYTNINSPYTLRFLEELEVISKENITFRNIADLISKSYINRVDTVTQKNEFSVKGDMISIWPVGFDHPIRMEFFGDELEKMYLIDENYSKKLHDIEYIPLSKFNLEDRSELDSIKISHNHNYSIKEYKRIIFSAGLLAEKSEDYEIVKTDFQYPNLYYS
ncbi:hypothetical protein IH575_03630, partial [Candidatus Dojkabacteria bacterium]|nr:hypothetical protein [Candidatus Dojkabacteria bacterium]